MSLKVLYITFTDFGELSSGSSVRPFRNVQCTRKSRLRVKALRRTAK